MGVSVNRCSNWLRKSLPPNTTPPKLFDDIRGLTESKEEIAKSATLAPLPSYINVTLKLNSIGLRIFGVTKEESLFTYQVLNLRTS